MSWPLCSEPNMTRPTSVPKSQATYRLLISLRFYADVVPFVEPAWLYSEQKTLRSNVIRSHALFKRAVNFDVMIHLILGVPKWNRFVRRIGQRGEPELGTRS